MNYLTSDTEKLTEEVSDLKKIVESLLTANEIFKIYTINREAALTKKELVIV